LERSKNPKELSEDDGFMKRHLEGEDRGNERRDGLYEEARYVYEEKSEISLDIGDSNLESDWKDPNEEWFSCDLPSVVREVYRSRGIFQMYEWQKQCLQNESFLKV
jgi:hypothetical protein